MRKRMQVSAALAIVVLGADLSAGAVDSKISPCKVTWTRDTGG